MRGPTQTRIQGLDLTPRPISTQAPYAVNAGEGRSPTFLGAPRAAFIVRSGPAPASAAVIVFTRETRRSGDLLTIHSANEPMGTHTATLQASDIGFPHTYVGTRLGEL